MGLTFDMNYKSNYKNQNQLNHFLGLLVAFYRVVIVSLSNTAIIFLFSLPKISPVYFVFISIGFSAHFTFYLYSCCSFFKISN